MMTYSTLKLFIRSVFLEAGNESPTIKEFAAKYRFKYETQLN